MIEFEATYFDGQTSADHAVQVSLEGSWLWVRGVGFEQRFAVNQCEITPALGKTRRVIRMPENAKLESQNLEAIAEMERQLGRNVGMTLVSKLEGRWSWVLVSLVGLVLFTAAFVRWGIPLVAQWAAFATPIQVMSPISQQTLGVLDRQFLKPSKLSIPRKEALEALFASVTQQIGQNHTYTLEFRQGHLMGANAFALPSGTIVFTDELIGLAKSDREIAGVMAHEVGHVIHRHSLRQVYQSVGVVMVVGLLLGDVTSVTSIGASLPAVLIQSGYSREFELQADVTAAEYMNRMGWGTQPLTDILERLTAEAGGDSKSLLSTHPATAERAKALERLSQPQP